MNVFLIKAPSGRLLPGVSSFSYSSEPGFNDSQLGCKCPGVSVGLSYCSFYIRARTGSNLPNTLIWLTGCIWLPSVYNLLPVPHISSYLNGSWLPVTVLPWQGLERGALKITTATCAAAIQHSSSGARRHEPFSLQANSWKTQQIPHFITPIVDMC